MIRHTWQTYSAKEREGEGERGKERRQRQKEKGNEQCVGSEHQVDFIMETPKPK